MTQSTTVLPTLNEEIENDNEKKLRQTKKIGPKIITKNVFDGVTLLPWQSIGLLHTYLLWHLSQTWGGHVASLPLKSVLVVGVDDGKWMYIPPQIHQAE